MHIQTQAHAHTDTHTAKKYLSYDNFHIILTKTKH